MNDMWLQLLQTTTLCCVLWGLTQWIRRLSAPSNSLANLPGPPSTSFVDGNFKQLFNAEAWRFHNDVSENYGSVAKVKGPFGSDQLYVYDPKAMHYILNKEQHAFDLPLSNMEGAGVIFGRGLFSTRGDHHRGQRKMLTPVFSAAHLRDMTPIFSSVTQKLLKTLLSEVADQPREIDMKHWLSRMALELIGQSGLGHSFDPLTKDATLHPYAVASENFGPTLAKLQFPLNAIYPLVYRIGTPGFQRFVISCLPWKTLHEARDIIDTFHNTSVNIFNAKKKAMLEGNAEALAQDAGRGKDIISVLMTQNSKALSEGKLPDNEVVGQMSTLVAAATDTTSSGLSQILYRLSINQDAQERLRAEILEAQERVGEELDYDTLSALPYLDAVCRETLRLYAPVPTSLRMAQKDTVIPLSRPIQGLDGKQITELAIPKGTRVYLAIMASNRNKDLWGPDAQDWKPERWLAPLPSALSEAKIPGVYANLMTFLGGGRSCIGFKFSQLEMKAALALLLGKLKFSLAKDKEIVWNYTVLATPAVRGDDSRAQQLPLIVSKV